MSLMGSLYVGNSGLRTSQNALHTTAHNMSNADTTGYVRQQVLQGTLFYHTIAYNSKAVSNQQVGMGVEYSKVKHVRDYFLDLTYRKEAGRQSFYEVSATALSEVENLLGELNGESFHEILAGENGLWAAIQELSKDPSSAVTQGLFVQKCAQFLERAQTVYDGLCNYQDNLNDQVIQKVDQINDYADELLELNKRIVKIEIGDQEEANDLRDRRDFILDELAKLGKISYDEDVFGNVSVQFESVDLVKVDKVYEMGAFEDPITGFYTPFWVSHARYIEKPDGTREYTAESVENAKVFDLGITISADLNTDIGALKSLLLARGDHRADYRDVLPANYSPDISQSVIMNVQAEFDQLIHSIATSINGVLHDAAVAAEAEWPGKGYLCNEDGSPIQVFQKKTSDGYTQDANGDWVFNAEDVTAYETLYSVDNLVINEELLQVPAMLGFIMPEDSVDYTTIEKLKTAFTQENITLNPNIQKKTNFINYYDDLVSQVANTGYIFNEILSNQETTVNATFSAREQVIGVSSDEELNHMIKFQNAYNASSRYINVVDEMLEHLIMSLAG
ncbi:MAG: flagellar hook-associated protein FlgK [Lachnospiraceae bacterium]|nr:flagellar hook-associated protein FlgK [Lachnospiraceae bacterium]